MLAAMLDPSWVVDVIIGGHSHTFIAEPAKVNDILIVQAGTGTDQIGRFDITVDTDNNCVAEYTWKPVPINADNCPRDERIEELIGSIKAKTDLKYAKVVANFDSELTHPDRWMQTALGSVFADAMKDSLDVDLFFMGSGSVRKEHLGPIVTFQDFTECYPYDGKSYGVKVTGAQLKRMLLHIYRDEAWLGDHTEFYQLSKGNGNSPYRLVAEKYKEKHFFSLSEDHVVEEMKDNLYEAFKTKLEPVLTDEVKEIVSHISDMFAWYGEKAFLSLLASERFRLCGPPDSKIRRSASNDMLKKVYTDVFEQAKVKKLTDLDGFISKRIDILRKKIGD